MKNKIMIPKPCFGSNPKENDNCDLKCKTFYQCILTFYIENPEVMK